MDDWQAFGNDYVARARFYLAHFDALQSHLPNVSSPDDAARCYGTGAMLLLVAFLVGVYRPRFVHYMLALPATLLCLSFTHALEMPAQYEVYLAPLLGAFLAHHSHVGLFIIMLHSDTMSTFYWSPVYSAPVQIAFALVKALVQMYMLHVLRIIDVYEMAAPSVVATGLLMASVHYGGVGLVPTPLLVVAGLGVGGWELRRQYHLGHIKL